MSFIGTIGANAADRGLADVLESEFSGVGKMLSGKTCPLNIRALKMLTGELLRELLKQDEVQLIDTLQSHLDDLSGFSRTSKLWIDTIIRSTLLMMDSYAQSAKVTYLCM